MKGSAKMSNIGTDTKRPGESTMGQIGTEARERVANLKERGQEAASNLTEKAKDAVSGATETAQQTAKRVGEKADSALSTVGGGMHSLAGTIRENMPQQGVLGRASEGVATSLDEGGRYLEREGFSRIAEDLTNVIRNNPIPALFCGIAIGFLLARGLRS
jgi:hypothetical protein